MIRLQCEECKHWKRTGAMQGECRKRAPGAFPYKDSATNIQMVGQWPMTYYTDWCDEFEKGFDA